MVMSKPLWYASISLASAPRSGCNQLSKSRCSSSTALVVEAKQSEEALAKIGADPMDSPRRPFQRSEAAVLVNGIDCGRYSLSSAIRRAVGSKVARDSGDCPCSSNSLNPNGPAHSPPVKAGYSSDSWSKSPVTNDDDDVEKSAAS